MLIKPILHRGLAILLALVLSVMVLAAALYLLGTSQPVMLQLMRTYAPPEATRLPAAEYPAMAEMIAAYLRGEREPFQLTYAVDGTEYLAFHDYEQQHMADCLQLFRLCRTILLGGLALSAALLALVIIWGDACSLRWLRGGLLCVLALVTVVAVLAVVDFDSLFILFHKVAFTNDLWLLDPRTDLLIRLMPIGFFISYAAIIGGIWLLVMVGLLVISTIRIKKMQDKGE